MGKVSFTYINLDTFNLDTFLKNGRARVRGFANSQSRRNQNFNFDKEQLNINEVSYLFDQIHKRIKESVDPGKNPCPYALLISLISGNEVEEFDRFYLIKRLSENSRREGIYSSKSGVYLRLYIRGSGIQGVELSKMSPARTIGYYIHLKVPNFIEELLSDYLAYVERSGSPTLFYIDSETLKQGCQNLLADIRDKRHKKLSLKRIAQYLRFKLSRHPMSDMATMLLILGIPTSVRIPASLYYTALDENRLARIYEDVCDRLEKDLGLKHNDSLFHDELSFKQHDETKKLMGTPYRLKRHALQKLIKDLKKDIRDLKDRDGWALVDYIRFHNLFSLYSYLFFVFVTALRKVKKPKFDNKHIDKQTGLAGLEDKRKSHKDNTRRVWLPPELLQQIEHYYQHFQVVYDRLSLVCTDLLALYQDDDDTLAIGYLFWIDEEKKTLEFFHPKLVKSILNDEYDYDMPLHSNRHYLRSMLLESRCPRQAIDSLLGHHSRGLEPSSSVSTLFQYDVIKAYEKHLYPIIKEDGWEALKGLEWSDI